MRKVKLAILILISVIITASFLKEDVHAGKSHAVENEWSVTDDGQYHFRYCNAYDINKDGSCKDGGISIWDGNGEAYTGKAHVTVHDLGKHNTDGPNGECSVCGRKYIDLTKEPEGEILDMADYYISPNGFLTNFSIKYDYSNPKDKPLKIVTKYVTLTDEYEDTIEIEAIGLARHSLMDWTDFTEGTRNSFNSITWKYDNGVLYYTITIKANVFVMWDGFEGTVIDIDKQPSGYVYAGKGVFFVKDGLCVPLKYQYGDSVSEGNIEADSVIAFRYTGEEVIYDYFFYEDIVNLDEVPYGYITKDAVSFYSKDYFELNGDGDFCFTLSMEFDEPYKYAYKDNNLVLYKVSADEKIPEDGIWVVEEEAKPDTAEQSTEAAETSTDNKDTNSESTNENKDSKSDTVVDSNKNQETSNVNKDAKSESDAKQETTAEKVNIFTKIINFFKNLFK